MAPRKSPEQAENRVLRDAKGRMLPGSTINPGGRPTIPPDVVEAARAHTMDAIQTLVRVMAADDANPGPAVAAAKALLDRAWGTSPATVEVKGSASAPLAGLTADQLVAIVKAGRE